MEAFETPLSEIHLKDHKEPEGKIETIYREPIK